MKTINGVKYLLTAKTGVRGKRVRKGIATIKK